MYTDESNQCCGNCKFYAKLKPEERKIFFINGVSGYICRKYPPVVAKNEVPVTCFPETYWASWCGEWEKMEEFNTDEKPNNSSWKELL